MNEFELIKHYFKNLTESRADVNVGIGDDAAVLSVPEGKELVFSTDTLISGVHFPKETSPEDIAYKSVAVNLSDLAAMGATPVWLALALTMPSKDEVFITNFCKGFKSLTSQYDMQLIGGDLTKGALSITVQAFGHVDKGCSLLRSGASVGDSIYVSNEIGAAGLGLEMMKEPFLTALNRPIPQIELGIALRGLASSCIDISDGLIADLEHICQASKVGAVLEMGSIPVAEGVDRKKALIAGDDYQLCFTVPAEKEAQLQSVKDQFMITKIGQLTDSHQIHLQDNGKCTTINKTGFQHF